MIVDKGHAKKQKCNNTSQGCPNIYTKALNRLSKLCSLSVGRSGSLTQSLQIAGIFLSLGVFRVIVSPSRKLGSLFFLQSQLTNCPSAQFPTLYSGSALVFSLSLIPFELYVDQIID